MTIIPINQLCCRRSERLKYRERYIVLQMTFLHLLFKKPKCQEPTFWRHYTSIQQWRTFNIGLYGNLICVRDLILKDGKLDDRLEELPVIVWICLILTAEKQNNIRKLEEKFVFMDNEYCSCLLNFHKKSIGSEQCAISNS